MGKTMFESKPQDRKEVGRLRLRWLKYVKWFARDVSEQMKAKGK
jgi:hypothetical protein